MVTVVVVVVESGVVDCGGVELSGIEEVEPVGAGVVVVVVSSEGVPVVDSVVELADRADSDGEVGVVLDVLDALSAATAASTAGVCTCCDAATRAAAVALATPSGSGDPAALTSWVFAVTAGVLLSAPKTSFLPAPRLRSQLGQLWTP